MDRLRTLIRGRGPRDGILLPTIGAVLLHLASGGAARLRAGGEEGGESARAAERCAREHRGGGESAPVDLGALERSYAAMKSGLALRLSGVRVDPEEAIRKPIDLGLPSCRGRVERRTRLPAELPREMRKSALRVVRAGNEVPEGAAKSPEEEILLVRAEGLGSAAELSQALGKRVTLAPPRLVRALGLRCAPTRVTFTEDGHEAILAEGE